MSKPRVAEIIESFDQFHAGDVCHVVQLKRPGLNVKLTVQRTGKTYSLYAWQIAHAMKRGYMRFVMEDPAKASWHCEVADKLCHRTDSGCIY